MGCSKVHNSDVDSIEDGTAVLRKLCCILRVTSTRQGVLVLTSRSMHEKAARTWSAFRGYSSEKSTR